MSTQRVLLIEFNELCPSLMDRFIAENRLPNFKRLRDQSDTFITLPDVMTSELLEPWIQWYSLHSGLHYDQHQVFHLTDGPRAGHDDLFSTLLAAGETVGCGGSMNVKGFASPGSFYFSDPWCDGERAYPDELNIYQSFISRMVREYSNPDQSNDAASALQFGSFLLRRGLSAASVTSIVSQLASEKLSDPALSWRRAAILDRLNLDVFSHYYRRHRPGFATFFSNSTAHLQHAYWRFMDPAPFSVKPSPEDEKRYGGAIAFGYEKMDGLLKELLALAGPDCLVVFATALGQQPYLRKEAIGGQHFYRPRKIKAVLDMVGVPYAEVTPTMTHQFMLRPESTEAAAQAVTRLADFTIEGKPLFDVRDHGAEGLYFGCGISVALPDGVQILDRRSNATIDFDTHFYHMDGTKGGCHHPEGMLWFRTGAGRRHAAKVSILDVYPTVLEALSHGDKIGADRRGRSLLPLFGGAEIRAAA